MYYTYVQKSVKDGKLYIGFCSNLEKRLKEHITRRVFATESRLPVTLIYYEACLGKDKAVAREKYFKTGFGRNFLKDRI